MPVPVIERPAAEAALLRFDAELRDTPEWAEWESNKSHRYAIRANGRLYPVKKILSLASGVPVDQFSGGRDANSRAKELGYVVEATQLPPEKDVAVALHELLIEHHPESVAANRAAAEYDN